MLAALALADRELMEKIISETFRHVSAPPAENGQATAKTKKADLQRERTTGAEIRDKVVAKIEECRQVLATEPPERFTAYWGSVSRLFLACLYLLPSRLLSNIPNQPESNNIIKPLTRKLKKCRDPDRWDLVALQQAKKESMVKERTAASLEDDGAVFGGDAGPRDAKRRKVSKAPEDPFGPALKV